MKGRKSSVTSIEESIDEDDDENESSENQESSKETEIIREELKETKSMFNHLIVTGHNDSSIKFWNENVISIYKMMDRQTISFIQN